MAQKTNDLRWQVDLYYQLQKIRIALGNRVDAIVRGADEGDAELLRRWYNSFVQLEEQVEAEIRKTASTHPVYKWLTSIKGVGPTLAAKLIALVGPDEAMAKRDTPSKLWAFAGLAPGQRLVKGQKASYNRRLKSLLYVIGTSILKARGPVSQYYYAAKERYQAQRPDWTPSHCHLAAMRKMSKVLLACLWEVWRESIGEPTRALYVVEKLGHKHVIRPDDLVGREPKEAESEAAQAV